MSLATGPASGSIVYTNETGGCNTITVSTKLPVSYEYMRNMKMTTGTVVSTSLPEGTAASEVTVTILLDGKQVKQVTGRGVQASASTAYVIGE